MGDLPTPASKAYLVTIELIVSVYKETHVQTMLGRFCKMFAALVQKIYCMERPMDRFTNGGRKSERELRWLEHETTATACCLVDILDSLRTNPNNAVQGYWLWAFV